MNVVVGGALAPVHTAPPPRPRRKAGPGFRLPSFEALGIAAPHPDRFEPLSLDGVVDEAVAEPVQHRTVDCLAAPCAESDLLQAYRTARDAEFDPKPELIDLLHSNHIGGRAISSPVQHYVATLTPPAESGDIPFPSMTTVSHGPPASPSAELGMSMMGTAAGAADAAVAGAGREPSVLISPPALDSDRTWIAEAVATLSRCS